MTDNNGLKNLLSQESREKALKSPKQIGEKVRVTAAPIYLLATAVLMMIGAFIVWGFLGNVTDKANYVGVVFPAQGTVDIGLPNKGVVRSMFVHTGDYVQQGQSIALVSIGDSYSFLTSKVNGIVIASRADNEPFEALDPIVSVIDTDAPGGLSQQTQLIAFADYDAQRALREGMEAEVWPSDEKRDEIGYVKGRVTRIDRYPVAAEVVKQTLKSDVMTQRLLETGGMMYQVQIELLPSKDNPKEYDWSVGVPDDVSMHVGTYCSVLSEVKRRSMFQYLFESVRTRFRAVQLSTE